MMNQELAYTEIEKLITNFKNMPAAQRKGLNEMQTRLGYILPMFKALGWDTSNINEVSPEEKVSRGWVDFSFRVGNVPRFFLETKRANEDLNDPRWVQQAIDYAWTKSVTWALLSDFEGLRVFNAEWKESDPFRAQFFEFGLDDYLKDFERLWWLSKEETSARRLDFEAEKVGRKIKRLPVSQNLFDDLKRWRENLFKNYKAFNLGYSAAQVDEAVLRLLNRLIFIRTAEDREVEQNRLQSLVRVLKDKRQIQILDRELASLFRELDGIYNSELFARHFSEELQIPPTELEEIINGLYQKDFVRYNFNALEADVLGTAYEQYLGHIVAENETETHVEEKRTKRKSQGIYYTPAFVTKYIVQQTVGKYLDENGYNPSKPPRVLDMACGSGSFLIEAFDLIDDFVAKQRGQAQRGEVDFYDRVRQLEILQSCIFGVDKDKQAVEVARLNLLLRGLHSREKLPMLENIVNADSLQNETYPFHFSKIMQEGGFDVIIGNPPYVRQETLGEEFKSYAKQNFETFAGTADLYIYFIEQAHKLLKPNGYFGMIVSNKWMKSNYGKALREFLARESALVEIIDFGELPVFENAATFPVIIITRKAKVDKQKFLFAPIKRLDFDSLPDEVKNICVELDESAIQGENWTLSGGGEQAILDKMKMVGLPLAEYTNGKVKFGIKTGFNEAFYITQTQKSALIKQDKKSSVHIKPLLVGDDIRNYHFNFKNKYLIRIPNGWTNEHTTNKENAWEWFKENYPALANHLFQYKSSLEKRQDKGDYWWELRACDYYNDFEVPKIIYPIISRESRFCIDVDNHYTNDKTYIIPVTDLYLLGLLNSKLIWLFLKRTCSVLGDPDKGGRLELRYIFMKQLPIYKINFDKPIEKTIHDEIVVLSEKLLALQKERQAVRPEDDLDHARNLDRRIKEVNSEIDKRVFKLYGLSDEEIKIVEGKQ
jgi:type I restriction-modification system DNA methylase subunit